MRIRFLGYDRALLPGLSMLAAVFRRMQNSNSLSEPRPEAILSRAGTD